MFSTPLQNMFAQGGSCPEFNGTCEGWDAWIERWLDFKRTFCSMGVDSDQVVAKVLMVKVDLATRTKWEMREEDGEVLTYAALMEDLEVDFGSNTRGLGGRRGWGSSWFCKGGT